MRKRCYRVTDKDIQYIIKYINKIPTKAIAEALDLNPNSIYKILPRLGLKAEGRLGRASKYKPIENKPIENGCDCQTITIEGRTQSVAEWITELYENYQALCGQVRIEESTSNKSVNHKELCTSLLRSNSTSPTSL